MIKLNFRKQDFRVLMFPDASDLFWGGSLTQVPEDDMVIWVPAAERSLQRLFEMTKHQGEYEMQDIFNIGEDPLKARIYKVHAARVGLDDEDPTWEPVEVMFKDVPKFLVRALRVPRHQRLGEVAHDPFRYCGRKFSKNLVNFAASLIEAVAQIRDLGEDFGEDYFEFLDDTNR